MYLLTTAIKKNNKATAKGMDGQNKMTTHIVLYTSRNSNEYAKIKTIQSSF